MGAGEGLWGSKVLEAEGGEGEGEEGNGEGEGEGEVEGEGEWGGKSGGTIMILKHLHPKR